MVSSTSFNRTFQTNTFNRGSTQASSTQNRVDYEKDLFDLSTFAELFQRETLFQRVEDDRINIDIEVPGYDKPVRIFCKFNSVQRTGNQKKELKKNPEQIMFQVGLTPDVVEEIWKKFGYRIYLGNCTDSELSSSFRGFHMGCDKVSTEYGECPNVYWARLLAISTMLKNRRRVILEGRQQISNRVEVTLPDVNDGNYARYKQVQA